MRGTSARKIASTSAANHSGGCADEFHVVCPDLAPALDGGLRRPDRFLRPPFKDIVALHFLCALS